MRSVREQRDDVLAVGAEVVLLRTGHQVHVELPDAVRLEVAELRDVILDRAEDAEAVAGLVVDELAVLGARAAVLGVVVELAPLAGSRSGSAAAATGRSA